MTSDLDALFKGSYTLATFGHELFVDTITDVMDDNELDVQIMIQLMHTFGQGMVSHQATGFGGFRTHNGMVCEELGRRIGQVGAGVICQSPEVKHNSLCYHYCEVVKKGLKYEEKLLKLFRMGERSVNVADTSNPRTSSFLPSCNEAINMSHSKNNYQCWTRIITDQGLCYASFLTNRKCQMEK